MQPATLAPPPPGTGAPFIAHVLCLAHHDAHADPDEARAIHHVAERFADALAGADPRFDRFGFIEAATRDPAAPAR